MRKSPLPLDKDTLLMRHSFALIQVVVAVTLCLDLASASDAVTSEHIFRILSPSVVLIEDSESHGSGVVLDESGTILTCFHVVCTPLPLAVIAEVDENGKRVRNTFTKIKITGVHPQSDLALIQIEDTQHAKFIPAPPSTPRNISPGEACFVIANQSMGNVVLSNTITTGIISSDARAIDGQTYIQAQAQINPESSGGALCDGQGEIIGLVAFKAHQREGMGFAISLHGFSVSQFIPVKERKPNYEKAAEYEEATVRWYDKALRADEGKKEWAFMMTSVMGRLLIVEAPNESSAYNKVGSAYLGMKKLATSKAFFKKALELNPDDITSYEGLGTIACNEANAAEATEYYRKGLMSKSTDKTGLGSIADAYSVMVDAKQEYRAAAYCMRWAMVDDSEPPLAREGLRQRVYNKALDQLPPCDIQYLKAKTTGFSWSDLSAFLQKTNAASLNTIGQDVDEVHRGSRWTHKLDLKTGTKIVIEDAPAGVEYDSATRVLTWNIPATQPPGEFELLINVSEPGSKEAYQRIRINVR